MKTTIEYHLCELDIALNPQDPRHHLPNIREEDRTILDIGCGIGQLFVACKLAKGVLAVGLDTDLDLLRYGRERYKCFHYINANGAWLPFRVNSFDHVVSRISLPYTNIPQTIREIARVLKSRGRIWLSLHSYAMQRNHLFQSLCHFQVKDIAFRSYVILNGFLLHGFGKLVAFPLSKKYQSFQTSKGITRLLSSNGFEEIEVKRGTHFIVTATKM